MNFPAQRDRSSYAPPAVDPLEQRTLFSFVTSYIENLNVPNDAAVTGELRIGDNGDIYGSPTARLSLGSSVADASWSTWDESPSNGIDSGWRDVAMFVTCGGSGTAQMYFDNGLLDSSSQACTSIDRVRITAGVADEGMSMEWFNVAVYFYRNGELLDTAEVGAFSANQLDEPGSGPLQAVTLVTPSDHDYDAVIVTGSVRLRASAESSPLLSEIFGRVQII